MPFKKKEFIVTDIGYSDHHQIFACVGTDSIIHFWNYTEKKIKYFKEIAAGSVQSRIWYLPLHRLWVTAGRDYFIRSWEIMRDNPLMNEAKFHTDEIMDLCEIDNPLCVATCGMDRRIVMYSVKDNQKIRVLEGDHAKGVKRMSYCSFNGGYLISIGYEVYANVWCPESIVGDILIGKLKGHSRPIIDTKFIGTSPFNVTIDENKEIRIWDIKSASCLQFVKPSIYTRI